MQPYETLEERLSEWIGRPAVVCSSGTAALHLALECLDLPRASWVAVPDFCFIACARAVTLAGHRPWLVGCQKHDLLVDLDCLDEAMSNGRVRAVLAVHTYGRRLDMDAVHALANKHRVQVVEDMAEIHGVQPHPQTRLACWSFHTSKIVHGEEGGCVGATDPASAVKARLLRTLGQMGDYHHAPRGHNYRLADLLAAPILDSLRNVKYNTHQRRRLEEVYEERTPAGKRMPPRDAPWVYDVRYGPGALEQAARLAAYGVRAPFVPISEQQEYLDYPRTGTTEGWQEVLVLPLGENAKVELLAALVGEDPAGG